MTRETAGTTDTERDDPLRHPDSARDWLAAFHKLEPGEQRGRLLTVLQAARASQRISREVLESVMETDQSWHPNGEDLDREFRRNPNAVTAEPLRFHQELAELSLAFAEIYSGYVDAYGKEPAQGSPGKPLQGCIALALFHFGRHAKYLYCRNEVPGTGFWPRLHALYLLATDRGFADERLLLFPKQEVTGTCSQLWLQAVMLATVSTGNLSPRQISRAEEWLRSWCARVTVDETYDANRHIYCVDIDGAQGPHRITPESRPVRPRYLGTKHLHQDILVARTRIVEDSMITTIGWYVENPLKEYFELLDRLQHVWVLAPASKSQRASVRVIGTVDDRVEIVRGLPRIITLCTGAAEPDPRLESLSVVDQSEQGYGLLAPVGARENTNLLELVAVRASRVQEWKIGVIARTTVLPSKGRLLGVHLLARTALLVSLAKQAAVADDKPDDLRIVFGDPPPEPEGEHAFFLVGDAAKNQADSLLSPAGAYAPGDRLKLRTAGQAFLIRINRLIQRGEGWERTGFRVLEKLITRLG